MEKRIAAGIEENTHRIEAMAYFSLASIALGLVHLPCYRYPVAYVRLTTEDQWGEYGTALGFFLTGFLSLLLCRGKRSFVTQIPVGPGWNRSHLHRRRRNQLGAAFV